jgi:hypothetical protein
MIAMQALHHLTYTFSAIVLLGLKYVFKKFFCILSKNSRKPHFQSCCFSDYKEANLLSTEKFYLYNMGRGDAYIRRQHLEMDVFGKNNTDG